MESSDTISPTTSVIVAAIFPSVLLFMSEIMPFLPNKYNGIVHGVYTVLTDLYNVYKNSRTGNAV